MYSPLGCLWALLEDKPKMGFCSEEDEAANGDALRVPQPLVYVLGSSLA